MLSNLMKQIGAVEVDYAHGRDPLAPDFEEVVTARLRELFAGTNIKDHYFSFRDVTAGSVTLNFEADDEDDEAVMHSALRELIKAQDEAPIAGRTA